MSNKRFQGKNVIVSGGAGGVGHAAYSLCPLFTNPSPCPHEGYSHTTQFIAKGRGCIFIAPCVHRPLTLLS